MSNEMEIEPSTAPGPTTIKAVAGLYNLVKLWARLPEDEARGKLSLALAQPELANAKNNKGSTGLHAAGYLRRWDLAKMMMAAGADPLIKNLAGHDFYTLLVTAPKAPWRELLSSHPDLISRQEAFLDERKRQATLAREKSGKKSPDRGDKKDKAIEPHSKGVEKKPKKADKFKRKSEASLDAEAIEKLRELQIIGLNGEMIAHGVAWSEATQSARSDNLDACLAWLKSSQLHPGYDPEGLTLAQELVETGDREKLSAALNAGLSPKTPNRAGETPLHSACRSGRADLAQALLTAGADPAHRSDSGETALSIACLKNDADMAERLLAFGASPSERFNTGESLVDAVERLGYFEIADILSAELEHQPFKPSAAAPSFLPLDDDESNDCNGNTFDAPKPPGSKGKKPSQKRSGPSASSSRASAPKPRPQGQSPKGASRGGHKRPGGKRSSPMIAKLDGPVKEVDEFARYSAPKSSIAAPVIIVKKSRLTRPVDLSDQEGSTMKKTPKPGM